MTFRKDRYESSFETEPFVLFGVHPYDMAAITHMDHFFTGQHEDEHYSARRKGCTLVVMDAQNVSANNFADYMDSAVSKKGGDVLLSRVKDGYLVEAHTPKGMALMKSLGKAKNATSAQLKEREKLQEANRKAMRKHQLKGAPSDLSDLLRRNYDNPLWKDRGGLCLSCGACNVVCPTCYCFDVQDEPDWAPNCATRCRLWDGCQLKDFAVVAGNHNFRKNASERYRHRFLHKGEYMPDATGEVSCVGCGRCITACVPKIANPVEVFNKLWGE